MGSPLPASTKAVGFWSAVLATAFSLLYVVAQLFEWAGMLGSQGGPESSSTPLGIVLLLTPSLFLGSSFLALQMVWHPLIWVASLWAVTFPGSTWALAIFFRRETETEK